MKFDSTGNPIPFGFWEMSGGDFKLAFAEIPEVIDRSLLYSGYVKYIQTIKDTLGDYKWEQWVGGGFTTTKTRPADIDLVNLVTEEFALLLNEDRAPFRTRRANEQGLCSKAYYKIDAYIVPILDKNDPRYHIMTESMLNYWKSWLGRDRNNNPRAIVVLKVA